MVKHPRGEAFHAPSVRSAEGVGPQAGGQQEFLRNPQPAECPPDQFALEIVAERPEGQHDEAVGRNPEPLPGLLAGDAGAVDAFVNMMRNHDVELLRFGVFRPELPEAVIAQVNHRIGIVPDQLVGFADPVVAFVRQGVVAGVDDRDSPLAEHAEPVVQFRDLFRRGIAPAEQLLGPLEMNHVVCRGVVPERVDRADDLEAAGADALGEPVGQRGCR